jgi:formylglycine-generating enzyme required for sulfatase activity
MAAVPGLPACIDRWEATIESGRAVARPGALPASAASWREVDAACRAAGKRLCTVEEWERACRGAEDRDFAYGARFDPTRCNGAARQPDAVRASVVPTGSLRDCATPEGVFDLSGNVWEWTAGGDPTGGLYELRGGGFGNQEDLLGCRPEDSLLQPADEGHSGYGFRCCANR